MAAQQYIRHVTAAGERWDLLAWRYYGDATNFGPMVMANPAIPIMAVFHAGIVLAVPILQQSQILTSNLPPWKQVAAGSA
jgi:phage tail protein X